ncbi:MAG: hypothetical protein OEZ10_08690 [Gammaproteobacteria bacterium]|nr:hypothetical protein [Gammaproteobacteria bacterium]
MQLIITDAGRGAIADETASATLPVTITEAALGSGKWSPDATATALAAEIKRISATDIGAIAIADDAFHVTITDTSADIYSLGEIGLYTDTGILFAIYSSPAGITDKATSAWLMLAADVVFTSVTPGSITITGAGFVNPPATETVAGVLSLATTAEAVAGALTNKGVTPATLAAVLAFFGKLASANTWTGENIFNGGITVDGVAQDIRQDEGRYGTAAFRIQPKSGNNNGVLTAMPSGSATASLFGLYNSSDPVNTSRLNISLTGNVFDINAATFGTGTPITSFNLQGSKIWTAGNDGAGSGLDADLLDGVQGAGYVRTDGSNAISGTLRIESNAPVFSFKELDALLDNKYWRFVADGSNFTLRAYNDALSSYGVAFSISRTGTTVNSLNVQATYLNHNGDKVWTAGNDGAGSGLDADTWQGFSPSQFLRADAGDTKTAGNLNFADGVLAVFGASNDLKIQHNGVHSYIQKGGIGHFYIDATLATNNIYLRGQQDGVGLQQAVDVISGSSVYANLRHNNQIKLQTKSTGVAVTGTLEAGNVTISGNQVWHAGNDGDGSGLDADKLNGRKISVQATEPVGATAGDLWVW